MKAPTVCVLLPGKEPSIRAKAMFDICRYGFETLLLVDASDLAGASPNRASLNVQSVASSELVKTLHDLVSRPDETVVMITAERAVTWINWLDLVPRLASQPAFYAALAYASDEPATPLAGLLTHRAIGLLNATDPLAQLAAQSTTVAVHYACVEPADAVARPAIFFDRDGVINEDHGYVGEISRFAFMPHAIAGVKAANDRGALAFLVTNQSGVARGYYTEQDVAELHRHMTREMRRCGAHFDDIRTCPHLLDGAVSSYRLACDCRKPEPGMLLDLMRMWPVDRTRSAMIGDKESDMQAARAAGVTGLLYTGGRLADSVAACFTPGCISGERNGLA